MSVVWLAQVECELVVDCKVVKTGTVDWVTPIVSALVTFLALVTNDTLGGAVATSVSVITCSSLAVALARFALAPVDWVAEVTSRALFTMFALSVVVTRLDACHPIQATTAVPITLASWKK